jgi:hypothetical protein
VRHLLDVPFVLRVVVRCIRHHPDDAVPLKPSQSGPAQSWTLAVCG